MNRKALIYVLTVYVLMSFLLSCTVDMSERTVQDKEQQYKAIVPTLFTKDEIRLANTAANISYLTEEEKKVILYINLARLDGKRFAKDFGSSYMELTGIAASNSYAISFYDDLSKVKGLQMLEPLQALCEAAAYHAEDLGKHGLTGHDSSDGTSFGDRIRRFLPSAGYWLENCSFGTYNSIAIVAVMQLLVDNNVPSLGHRKNILNAEMTHVGVAIRPHQSTYKYGCVQDFAGRMKE